MPAATAKKPTAYREGRADKTKKPSIEVEIAPEGEEEEEGMEGQEMDAAKTNRKRSAKGAKHTKAPMDGDCGCGGGKGKKCTCDGGCGGGYAKKMDRSDALTPQEYLAACELGIQGRSRSYIRARLDAAERLDLKCGKGSISPGEKCTKGTAQQAPSEKQRATSSSRNIRRRVAGNALTAIGTVGNLATAYGTIRGLSTANSATISKAIQRQAAFSALAGAGQHLTASGTTDKQQRAQLRAQGNSLLTSAALGGLAGHTLGGGYTKGVGFNLSNVKRPNTAKAVANVKGTTSALIGRMRQRRTRASLERMYRQPGRRDSVYAAGFSTELDQLAI